MSKPLKIIIKSGKTKVVDDTFYVAVLSDPADALTEDVLTGEVCLSIDAAIGSLIRAHPKRFNVEMWHGPT